MSTECERALLGSILLDPPTIDRVAAVVTGRDFADPDLGRLYDHVVILHQADVPIGDVKVLVPELRRAGLPPAVITGYFLAQLSHEGLAYNAERYAQDVARDARIRSHQGLAQDGFRGWKPRTRALRG